MTSARRFASVAVTTAIALGSVSVPAMATTTHWSKSQCQSYEKGFLKRNPHASKTRKTTANKVLKGQGCSVRVK